MYIYVCVCVFTNLQRDSTGGLCFLQEGSRAAVALPRADQRLGHMWVGAAVGSVPEGGAVGLLVYVVCTLWNQPRYP